MFLISRKVTDNFLQAVVEHVIGDGHTVYGKIAFHHAALYPKTFDGVQVVGSLGQSKFVGSRWCGASMPAKAIVGHGQAANFEGHVWQLRQVCHCLLPDIENLVLLAGKFADAQGRAEVIENHLGIGCGPGQVGEFAELVVILPGIVGHAHLAQ